MTVKLGRDASEYVHGSQWHELQSTKKKKKQHQKNPINFTYLWVKHKVRAAIFNLNSQELFLIFWREGRKQEALQWPSVETQLDTW